MSEHKKCHVEPINKPLDKAALENAEESLMAVSGMGCPKCATRVSNSLLSLDGVLTADVELEKGLVSVAYDPEHVKPSDFVKAVAAAGNERNHSFLVEVLQTNLAT